MPMRVDRAIREYMIFSGECIYNALKRINDNQSRIIFVVEDNGVITGSISDGDFRRWITTNANFDLNQPVDNVMNKNFISMRVTDHPGLIEKTFAAHIDIIPLTDSSGRFVAIARKSMAGFQIGDFAITDDSNTFIIAEIGNNHNGDFTLAKQLIDLAVTAGADCVKFQMRDLDSLYTKKGKHAEVCYDLGSQYTLDILKQQQLTKKQFFALFDYCYKKNTTPLCTPWDAKSLHALEEYGVEAYKVASADFTNYELLDLVSQTEKPLICSTGMCTESEVQASIAFLRKKYAQFALLHCNSTYPTPFKDVNLKYIHRLKKLSKMIVGYSGHERGYSVPIAAVALGAKIIEKHFTIDRDMIGIDHKCSLLPEEFAQMVKCIREVESATGQDTERQLTQGEYINRENLAKSLVASKPIRKGDVIKRDMIEIKSPGLGLQPNRFDALIGRVASRDLDVGDYFYESDLTHKTEKKARYSFSRPYGIPVRYHDFCALTHDIHLDFVEFHFSYNDLKLNASAFFTETSSMSFTVHCPELFENDHVLDLASNDVAYRSQSMKNLQCVIDITRQLKTFFPQAASPLLIINAGGWSLHEFAALDEKQSMYNQVAQAFAALDFTGVTPLIQTMPPFPWHFGGQRHHNLFVDPDEIADFCRTTGVGVCLDVSHSQMACTYYQWDFEEFLKKILPYAKHLHIMDAKGIDGEGVQIGQGDVDFLLLQKMLKTYAPGVSFIPEAWQGHKNDGEGFWRALQFLEKIGV